MAYTLLNGKELAKRMKTEMAREVEALVKESVLPGLAVVIVGDDPASRIYVKNKRKDCEEVGIRSFEYALPAETHEDQLLELIDALNEDDAVDGILVQLPLPGHLSEEHVLKRIAPHKDVDAFHPFNVGELVIGRNSFVPCTPSGVMALLKDAGIEVKGKSCVVVGRSNIVGKPMALLLLHADGTVTVCHSKTRDLEKVCAQADILVAAIGRPGFITEKFVKPGAVVVDVGINRLPDGTMTGDVDFNNVAPLSSYITPVPGGVGPMTRAMLLTNTIKAAKMHKKDRLS